MNKHPLIVISILIGALANSGCATTSTTTQVYDPNKQLDEVLSDYVKVKTQAPQCLTENYSNTGNNCSTESSYTAEKNQTCYAGSAYKVSTNCQQKAPELALNLNCHDNRKPIVDCYRLASALNALNMQYPNNKRIMMAAAFVEFELGNMSNSQQLLDNLLSKRGAYPEAAILRARIAMEEGNLTLARSIVAKQLNITPDNPYLYEMQASYYYMEGKYTEALQSVKTAERFMEPNWRIGHHRGIIYEGQEQWNKACTEYKAILRDDPNNRVINAKARLLNEHVDCFVSSKYAQLNRL